MINLQLRTWDERDKKFIYQGTPDLETLQSFIFHYGDKDLTESTYCRDKDNREIYEGDTVKITYSKDNQIVKELTGLIEFGICNIGKHGTNGFYIRTNDINEPLIGLYPALDETADVVSIEVISHIHENSETDKS